MATRLQLHHIRVVKYQQSSGEESRREGRWREKGERGKGEKGERGKGEKGERGKGEEGEREREGRGERKKGQFLVPVGGINHSK